MKSLYVFWQLLGLVPFGRRRPSASWVLSNNALSFIAKQTTFCLLAVVVNKYLFTIMIKKKKSHREEDVLGRNSVQKQDLLGTWQNIHATGDFPRDNSVNSIPCHALGVLQGSGRKRGQTRWPHLLLWELRWDCRLFHILSGLISNLNNNNNDKIFRFFGVCL